MLENVVIVYFSIYQFVLIFLPRQRNVANTGVIKHHLFFLGKSASDHTIFHEHGYISIIGDSVQKHHTLITKSLLSLYCKRLEIKTKLYPWSDAWPAALCRISLGQSPWWCWSVPGSPSYWDSEPSAPSARRSGYRQRGPTRSSLLRHKQDKRNTFINRCFLDCHMMCPLYHDILCHKKQSISRSNIF